MTDDTPAPHAATGATTLIEVLDAAATDGYGAPFVAVGGGSVRCTSCDEVVPAADLDVVRTDRLEGASDAADMMLVVRADCPGCDSGGTLVVGYGPNATEADEAVLGALVLPDGPADPTRD